MEHGDLLANAHSLHKLVAKFDVFLHPSKANDIMGGVRDQLSTNLLR
jgi:hypothetical protein